MREKPVSVLVVCTGNVCRSPVAERLLGARLGDTVEVGSAGTHALAGHEIVPPLAIRLERGGVDSGGFAARQLTPELLGAADVVLALTRQHRGAAVELRPATVRRAFVLGEFAQLVSTLPVGSLPAGSVGERLRAAIPLAMAACRQVFGPPDPFDIADPYCGSDADYAGAFDRIRSAVDLIGDVLAPCAVPASLADGGAGSSSSLSRLR